MTWLTFQFFIILLNHRTKINKINPKTPVKIGDVIKIIEDFAQKVLAKLEGDLNQLYQIVMNGQQYLADMNADVDGTIDFTEGYKELVKILGSVDKAEAYLKLHLVTDTITGTPTVYNVGNQSFSSKEEAEAYKQKNNISAKILTIKGTEQRLATNNQKTLEESLKTLGGKIDSINDFTLPGGDTRAIINVKKISQTSPKYPRPSAQIAKKPL